MKNHQAEKSLLEKKLNISVKELSEMTYKSEANLVLQGLLNQVDSANSSEIAKQHLMIIKRYEENLKQKQSEISTLELKLNTKITEYSNLRHESEANFVVQGLLSSLERDIFKEEIKKHAIHTKLYEEESSKKHKSDILELTTRLNSLEQVHSKLNYEKEAHIVMQHILDQVENENLLKLNQISSKTGLHLMKNHFKEVNSNFTAMCKKFMKPQTDLNKL